MCTPTILPKETTIQETQLIEGILCSVSFRNEGLSDYQKRKILEAIKVIMANDRPFMFTPECKF